MTNSDIIAIVAIVVSGIVSVATLLATFLTTRMNHKAELRKIAYEKQIEALREVYESLADFCIASTNFVAFIDDWGNDNEETYKILNKWQKADNHLQSVYRKNAVFIPKKVDDVFYNRNAPKRSDINTLPTKEQLERINQHDERVLNEIKKYLYK